MSSGLLLAGAVSTILAYDRAVGPRRHPLKGVSYLDESLDPLRTHFNRHRGLPRLVAVFSPSCPVCFYGATAFKTEVLDRLPEAGLSVSVVWIEFLPWDVEQKAARRISIFADDPRVRQFYDPSQRSGRAIAESLGWGSGEVAWYAYSFYPPGANWQDSLPRPTTWLDHRQGLDPGHFVSEDDWTPVLRRNLEALIDLATPRAASRLE